MTQTISQTGTGDQHSHCEELVCCTENNIGICLHGQHSNPMHSETDHSRMDSCPTYLHQATGTGNKKIDFKYDLLVCQTSPSPASHKIIKKTVATGLAHHISEVIKLSLAFKTQLIFLRPDTPNHRNSIGSSLRHNDYVQCRHCSNSERDRPNLGSESPTYTVPMKLYHGSASCDTVNTRGTSKSSECRRPSNLIDYTTGQALISAATQLHKCQPPEYPTIMVGDSRPSMQPTNDYYQGTQGMGGRVGDSRPPGHPPDVHEDVLVVPVPIGIAKISRASPEGDKTPDNCHRWTSQPLDFIKLTGDGRAPGEPPDHEGTSHPMDSIREMGDGRPPPEPPDHNTILGLGEHRPSGRPLTAYCADNSLILLRSTSSNESTQVIDKSRIENNPHLNLHHTNDLSNGRFLPVLTKLEVAVLTDYGAQKHHKWSSQVKVPFFIIEYQTYHVDVNISAPDEMLLKGEFLSRHNCIPEWDIGAESEAEYDFSYPSDVIKSPGLCDIPRCQNNSTGPHDMLL